MLTVTTNATEFHNVGAGAGTANIKLETDPIGLATIELDYRIGGVRATEAQMNTDILEIAFKIGGTEQRTTTPARLFSGEKLKGRTVTDGRCPIRFTAPERRTVIGEDRTALFPHVLGEISIDVKLAANVTARTLTARLVGHKLTTKQALAIKSQPNIITYTEEQVQVTGVGQKTFTYDQPQGRAISMAHCYSADITAMRILLGDLVLYDFIDKTQLDMLLEDAGYVPQANIWSIGGELLTGRFDDALAASNRSLKFEFTMGAANDFDVRFEELGTLKR